MLLVKNLYADVDRLPHPNGRFQVEYLKYGDELREKGQFVPRLA
jgi:hypothetical protein